MVRHYEPPGSSGGAEGAAQGSARGYGMPPVDLAESVAAVSGAAAGTTNDSADVEMAEAKDDDTAVDLTGDDDIAVAAATYA